MALITPTESMTFWDFFSAAYRYDGTNPLEEGVIRRNGNIAYKMTAQRKGTQDLDTASLHGTYSGEWVIPDRYKGYIRIGAYVAESISAQSILDQYGQLKNYWSTNVYCKAYDVSHNIVSLGRIIGSVFISDIKTSDGDIVESAYNTNGDFGNGDLHGRLYTTNKTAKVEQMYVDIVGNLKILHTEKELNDWLVTGDIDTPTTRIFHGTAYSGASSANLRNATDYKMTIHQKKEGERICGYVSDMGGNGNIRFVYSAGFKNAVVGITEQKIGEKSEAIDDLSNIINPFGYWTDIVSYGGTYYKGTILSDTNIPIYASEGDALDYVSGGNPPPLYNPETDGGGGDGENETGEPDDATEMNDAVNEQTLSSVYIADKVGMDSFSDRLFSYDSSIFDAITEGLKRYGENPINFMVDAFLVPFDVTTFVTTRDTDHIPFGSYEAHVNVMKKVIQNNTLLTMAQVDIGGSYNDYRDYVYNYYIYLPYVGIAPLDVELFYKKTLVVKAFFDVRTGNIKYYLFANQNLAKTVEGNIRVSMPLTGSDKAAQASQYISGAESILSGAVGIGGGIASSVASGSPSGVGGIGSGGLSVVNGVLDLQKGSPKSVSGNNSPSTAIKDPLYIYLIVEKPQFTDANGIRSAYNKPDNNYRTVGACSGYLKMTDVRLESTANATERDMIISLLNSGVYVD